MKFGMKVALNIANKNTSSKQKCIEDSKSPLEKTVKFAMVLKEALGSG